MCGFAGFEDPSDLISQVLLEVLMLLADGGDNPLKAASAATSVPANKSPALKYAAKG